MMKDKRQKTAKGRITDTDNGYQIFRKERVSMKKLTSRQEEYLFLFADRDGRGKGISEAAEQFRVSKPTAFSISGALEERGMIEKGSFGEIRLTERGWSYIAPKLDSLNVLTEWLECGLGLPPVVAEQEARRMVVNLLPETVSAMTDSWRRQREEYPAGEEDTRLSGLAAGLWSVPFRVCRPGSGELSMGDLGFRKPALLVKEEESSFFLLCPQNVKYRPQKRSHLQGILEKLWYRTSGGWREAEVSGDGSRRIPGAAVLCRETEEGLTGTVSIRARASVGMLGMPESEAEVVFLLDRMERESEREEDL